MLVMIMISGSHFFLSYNNLHKQAGCYSMLHSVTEFLLNKMNNWTSDQGNERLCGFGRRICRQEIAKSSDG